MLIASAELRECSPIVVLDEVISTHGISHETLQATSEMECLVRCLNRPRCGAANLKKMTENNKTCEVLKAAVGDNITILPEVNSVFLGKYNNGYDKHMIRYTEQ